jgi:Uma2 family endonuclease
MAFPQAVKQYTIEEYLAMERNSLEKHEYYRGEIFAMSGASLPYNRIQMNFTGETRTFLKGKGCDVFGSDLRVHIPTNGLYTYPDAVIVCGEPQLADQEMDALLNPAVIAEVLSRSTQSYDRGDKFALYRVIPTLKEYILIASENVGVEHYTKQDDATWILKEWHQLNEALYIKTIDFSLPLSELYSGVAFAA